LPIAHIHTYLVHPSRGSGAVPKIGGTTVPLSGKLFKLLDSIYSKSDKECKIDIAFNHNAGGAQQNDCRDLIIKYLSKPTLPNGRCIANRLAAKTDQRSGIGLLFLISGMEGQNHKILISRFPTDVAILAEEKRQTLTVAFLERVFMKSATSYKAVVYDDSSLHAGLWLGRAVDKQINSGIAEVSNYWIFDFLDSNFKTTAAAGSRRLGAVLRNAAAKSEDIVVKSEIAAAVTLAGSLKGRSISIQDFEQQFGLSPAARQAIDKELSMPGLATENFQFDFDEFSTQVGYRSVELNNGGVLTAQSSDFDNVFHREVVDPKAQKVRFSTEGKVISEKLRKAK
jgi:hypothetical protein